MAQTCSASLVRHSQPEVFSKLQPGDTTMSLNLAIFPDEIWEKIIYYTSVNVGECIVPDCCVIPYDTNEYKFVDWSGQLELMRQLRQNYNVIPQTSYMPLFFADELDISVDEHNCFVLDVLKHFALNFTYDYSNSIWLIKGGIFISLLLNKKINDVDIFHNGLIGSLLKYFTSSEQSIIARQMDKSSLYADTTQTIRIIQYRNLNGKNVCVNYVDFQFTQVQSLSKPYAQFSNESLVMCGKQLISILQKDPHVDLSKFIVEEARVDFANKICGNVSDDLIGRIKEDIVNLNWRLAVSPEYITSVFIKSSAIEIRRYFGDKNLLTLWKRVDHAKERGYTIYKELDVTKIMFIANVVNEHIVGIANTWNAYETNRLILLNTFNKFTMPCKYNYTQLYKGKSNKAIGRRYLIRELSNFLLESFDEFFDIALMQQFGTPMEEFVINWKQSSSQLYGPKCSDCGRIIFSLDPDYVCHSRDKLCICENESSNCYRDISGFVASVFEFVQ